MWLAGWELERDGCQEEVVAGRVAVVEAEAEPVESTSVDEVSLTVATLVEAVSVSVVETLTPVSVLRRACVSRVGARGRRAHSRRVGRDRARGLRDAGQGVVFTSIIQWT